MTSIKRVGVVGVGSMGANHVRVYSNRPDVELVGIVDPSEEKATQIASRFSTHWFVDPDKFIDECQPDAVSIAAPTHLHRELTEKFLSKGIHCLLEKPIASNLEEAEHLGKLAEEKGAKLLIGHIERFNPAVQALRSRLQNNEAGDIYRIEIERSGPFPPRITGTGVILDLAVHDLDIIQMLMQKKPTQILVDRQQLLHTKYEDAVTAILRFENDVLATLNVNWTSPVKSRILKVYGMKGMYQVDYVKQELRFFENADQTSDAPAWENPGIKEGREVKYMIPMSEPLANEIGFFLEAIDNDLDTSTNVSDATAALKMALDLETADCVLKNYK